MMAMPARNEREPFGRSFRHRIVYPNQTKVGILMKTLKVKKWMDDSVLIVGNGESKFVKAYWRKGTPIECKFCGSDKAEYRVIEETNNGYVWETECRDCRKTDTGYEF